MDTFGYECVKNGYVRIQKNGYGHLFWIRSILDTFGYGGHFVQVKCMGIQTYPFFLKNGYGSKTIEKVKNPTNKWIRLDTGIPKKWIRILG